MAEVLWATGAAADTPAAGYITVYSDSGDSDHLKQKDSAGTIIDLASGGDVSGPGASTDNAIARWDGAGGDTLQDSSVIVTDADAVSGMTLLTMSGNIDLDGNDLILDADGDSYLHASADDVIDLVLAGAGGEFGITINAAEDFTFTANLFNVLSGSSIIMADGADIGIDGAGVTLTFNHTADPDRLELDNGDLRIEDDFGLVLGDDLDAKIIYDEAGDDRVEVTGAAWYFDSVNVGVDGHVSIYDGNELRLYDTGSSHYISQSAPALTANEDYIWPAAADDGKYLKVGADGTMSWDTPASLEESDALLWAMAADSL